VIMFSARSALPSCQHGCFCRDKDWQVRLRLGQRGRLPIYAAMTMTLRYRPATSMSSVMVHPLLKAMARGKTNQVPPGVHKRLQGHAVPPRTRVSVDGYGSVVDAALPVGRFGCPPIGVTGKQIRFALQPRGLGWGWVRKR
jgi:hypothetical protein